MSNPFGAPTQEAQGGFEFSVDITDVASNFVIPVGMYPAKVVGVAKQIAKSSGNPMIVFTFALIGGAYSGREFKSFCSLSPAALFKIAEILTALKVGKVGSVANFNAADVMNKACLLQIEDGEYNGDARSEIKKVHEHPDGPGVFDISLSRAVAAPAALPPASPAPIGEVATGVAIPAPDASLAAPELADEVPVVS